ncbi:uracil-DNA glycosylase family protein [Oceanobacillus halotolerans]|uniref:uracil-DNA glycosylase family protein n=1 Tax=Oceanobacillus halotolerans TaxID=2663380 RepID=UPI0013CFD054|nr:uracil-DNA glycosylase family protein [Oceanobacillus halotolerans]
MVHKPLQQFLPAIQTLHADKPLTKEDLLTETFLMEKDGDMEIYYAPHNEYINKEARVVIVGITPGWSQMKTAFEQFIKSNESDDTLEMCLKEAKRAAGFAEVMRKNLINMLDQCDIHKILDIPNSSYLFGKDRHFLHTTSIIKYPVFIKGKNYTGHQPPIDRSPLLQRYAYREFPNELAQIAPPALVIPLGKTVEQTIIRLSQERKLPNHDYLTGFPHPSGANGHRIKQFQQQKQQLREKVKAWAARIE